MMFDLLGFSRENTIISPRGSMVYASVCRFGAFAAKLFFATL